MSRAARNRAMIDDIKATMLRHLDGVTSPGEREDMALDATAMAAGIAAGVMERARPGTRVSAARLLTAILKSDVITSGFDADYRARPH